MAQAETDKRVAQPRPNRVVPNANTDLSKPFRPPMHSAVKHPKEPLSPAMMWTVAGLGTVACGIIGFATMVAMAGGL
ncbi:hypothetical protein HZA76_05095 [Candidatus Roizmanbacteria bacterium]|nr:hypothetical protein [Candidatus Roizmanbacteria bacterium]